MKWQLSDGLIPYRLQYWVDHLRLDHLIMKRSAKRPRRRSRSSDQDRAPNGPNRNNRSEMWNHFLEVKSVAGQAYAKCKHCPAVQDYDKPINPGHPKEKGLYKKDGTGNLKTHMLTCHVDKMPPPTLPVGQMQLNYPAVTGPVFKVTEEQAVKQVYSVCYQSRNSIFSFYSLTMKYPWHCWYHLWWMGTTLSPLLMKRTSESSPVLFAKSLSAFHPPHWRHGSF